MLFCKMRVHSDFQIIKNCWDNGLKGGKFIREGSIIYLISFTAKTPMGNLKKVKPVIFSVKALKAWSEISLS